MSKPSNIRSSGGMCRLCRGIKHVNLGAAAVLLSSSLLSSSLSSSADRAAGVGAGVGAGGVQWLLRRTARPVLSDSLNASRVLRRRIYNRVYKHCLHSLVLMMMFIGCQHGGIYVEFLLCRYWNFFTRNLNHACHKVPRADVWWNVPSRKESSGWL